MTLQASQLAYARGHRRLFSNLAFEVGAGQALRVTGRNGAGKTTLLRLVSGLLTPLEGVVRWHGQDIGRDRQAFHRALVHVGHAVGLKDELSALENVQASAWFSGGACTRGRALAALARLGLAAQAGVPARVLSQGQRRRVALARLALLADKVGQPGEASRRLLVLDEPFVALDQESESIVCALLDDQLRQGATLVYTTHQPPRLNTANQIELRLGEETSRAQRCAAVRAV